MFEFGNITYYFDLSKLDELITVKAVEHTTEKVVNYDDQGKKLWSQVKEFTPQATKEVNSVKYSLYESLIMVILDNQQILDDTLGIDRAMNETPLAFKLAFNTLLNDGIIKEKK